MSSTATFYDWLNDTVIPFVFPRVSYINIPLAANQRLYVNDQNNFRVGTLRVRQVRALEGWCKIKVAYEYTVQTFRSNTLKS